LSVRPTKHYQKYFYPFPYITIFLTFELQLQSNLTLVLTMLLCRYLKHYGSVLYCGSGSMEYVQFTFEMSSLLIFIQMVGSMVHVPKHWPIFYNNCQPFIFNLLLQNSSFCLLQEN